MPWAALGCFGLLWASLGCFWAAVGCLGLLWAALGCSGLLLLLWAAFWNTIRKNPSCRTTLACCGLLWAAFLRAIRKNPRCRTKTGARRYRADSRVWGYIYSSSLWAEPLYPRPCYRLPCKRWWLAGSRTCRVLCRSMGTISLAFGARTLSSEPSGEEV